MYVLPIDHHVKMQVGYVDVAGNPATVDNAPAWTTSDSTLVALTVDGADPTIVDVVPQGPLGQVQVTATVDADLGEGVRNIITTIDISLQGGEAVSGTIQPVGPAEPLA